MGKKPIVVDPATLYEMKIDDNLRQMRNSRELLPRLISEYIPKQYFRTANLYIDPFAKWNAGSFLVAPPQRVREKKRLSVLGIRTWFESLDRRGEDALYPHYGEPSFNSNQSANWVVTRYLRNDVPVSYEWSKDTTDRLRGYNCPFGEFEKLKILEFQSPDRSHMQTTWIESYANGYGGVNYSKGRDVRTWGVHGGSAYFRQQELDWLRDTQIPACKDELVKSGPRALTGCLPAYRPFTFGRSFIELRDLPHSLLTLRQTAERLRDVYSSMGSIRDVVFSLTQGSKQVPREYLGYHFAWKQMYEDVLKLITSPERVAKRFNYLQQRAGKVTTFRHTIKYPLPDGPETWLLYDQIVEFESDRVVTHSHKREIELRAMTSLYFDFPPVALPVLRENRVKDMLGLRLRPTDLYKVYPWTWLYDWFTNLGSYVDLIDTANRDKLTINYGFVTAVLRGKLESTYSYRYLAQRGDTIYADDHSRDRHYEQFATARHVSHLRYEVAVRRHASNLGANTLHILSTRSNLTAWQKSILAALLATRVKS